MTHPDRDHDGVDDLPRIWQAIPVSAAVLSLICCTWLLARALPCIALQRRRKVLILRQLVNLTWADLLMAIAGCAMFIPKFVDIFPMASRLGICIAGYYGVWLLLLWGLFASILIESHIGLGVAAATWRWHACCRFLQRSLLWSWPFSLALSLIAVLSQRPDYSVEDELCTPLRTLDTPMLPVLVGVATITNLLAYSALLRAPQVQPSVSPECVSTRAWRQALRICMVTIVIWLPYWFVLFVNGDVQFNWTDDVEEVVCTTAIGLQGVLNVWCYAMPNRRIRRALSESRLRALMQRHRQAPETSFHPFFAEDVDIVDIANTMQHAADDNTINSGHGQSLAQSDSEPSAVDATTPPETSDKYVEISRALASTACSASSWESGTPLSSNA